MANVLPGEGGSGTGVSGTPLFARVGGSGFTWFKFRETVVAFAQAIAYTSPAPVTDPVTVQPLNYRRPVEILVPRAIGAGTITLTMIELWNQPVWHRLVGLGGGGTQPLNDLADVFQAMWNSGTDDLTATVVIDPPPGRPNVSGKKYTRNFHGIKITDIRDDETIDITTMQMNKPVTMMYAWSTINGAPQVFASEIGTS